MTALGGDGRRYELKSEFAPGEYDYLLARILAHPLHFREFYEPRRVYNLYFDTFLMENYFDNLIGVSRRMKLRYRWYGDTQPPASGLFEVKCKDGLISWKLRAEIRSAILRQRMPLRSLVSGLLQVLPGKFSDLLRVYNNPAVANCYDRRYFETACRMVRVTLDRNIRIFNQSHGGRLNLEHHTAYPLCGVIEFKCAEGDRDAVKRCFQSLPLRVTRFSKYVTGIQSTYANY